MNGTVNPLYGGNNMNGGTVQPQPQAQTQLIDGTAKFIIEIIQTLQGLTKNIKNTSNISNDNLTSIISTVMQVLSNSFTGGMNGMKAELDKIIEKHKDSDDGAMVEFLIDCGSFLNYFIQYSTLNRQIQYQIINSDDDKLEDTDAETIDKFKKELSNAVTIRVVEDIMKKIKNKIKEVEKTKVEETKVEETKASGNNELFLKKLKNIGLEFYQEKLNNSFQLMAYTYGQLSGRTLYNLSKLLGAGGQKDVGLFAPLTMGSLAGSAARLYPGVGPVLDTINEFFSSFSAAFEMSYKELKRERELANQYIKDMTESSTGALNNKNLIGGNIFIKKDTTKKLFSSSDNKNGDNNNQSQALEVIGRKNNNSHVHVPEFSKAKAESDLKLLNEILSDYYHVMSLMELIKIIGQGKVEGDSIYIGNEDDKLLKLQKITKQEFGKLVNNKALKQKFKDLHDTLNETINQSKPATLSDGDKYSIEKNNPVLYGIVKNFIKTTYENLGNKGDEDIKNKLEDLMKFVSTASNIEEFLQEKKNLIETERKKNTEKLKDVKKQQTTQQIDKLKEILAKEKRRMQKLQEDNNSKTEAETVSKTDSETDIPSSIEEYKKIIEQNLKDYNDEVLADIGAKIVASNSFKPLKKLVSNYKKLLESGVKQIIDGFKAEYNKKNDDNNKKNDKKNEDEKRQIYKVFGKLLKFIQIKNFEAVNTGLAKFEKYAKIVDDNAKTVDKKLGSIVTKKINNMLRTGGSMRSSTIKRRIKKATRRIQLSLDEFNSGRNTRRCGYRKKPRKTRRVNYGH